MNTANFLRLLLLAAIWGGSFLFMRIGAPVLGPAVPSTRPVPLLKVMAWRAHSAPSSAPHIGAVAFSTDSTEAVKVRAP